MTVFDHKTMMKTVLVFIFLAYELLLLGNWDNHRRKRHMWFQFFFVHEILCVGRWNKIVHESNLFETQLPLLRNHPGFK